MTTPATQAKQHAYGAPYGQRKTGADLTPHPIYQLPRTKYSRTFFIALIVAVASTVGFFGLLLSLFIRL